MIKLITKAATNKPATNSPMEAFLKNSITWYMRLPPFYNLAVKIKLTPIPNRFTYTGSIPNICVSPIDQ
jgi:hypothetical protein